MRSCLLLVFSFLAFVALATDDDSDSYFSSSFFSSSQEPTCTCDEVAAAFHVNTSDALCHGTSSGFVSAYFDSCTEGLKLHFQLLYENKIQASSSGVFTGLRANVEYRLTGSAGSCKAEKFFSISEPSKLVFSGMSIKEYPSTCTSHDGSVELRISGGVPPYYVDVFESGDSALMYNESSYGKNSLVVTDSNMCLMDVNFVIDVPESCQEVSNSSYLNPESSGINDHIWLFLAVCALAVAVVFFIIAFAIWCAVVEKKENNRLNKNKKDKAAGKGSAELEEGKGSPNGKDDHRNSHDGNDDDHEKHLKKQPSSYRLFQSLSETYRTMGELSEMEDKSMSWMTKSRSHKNKHSGKGDDDDSLLSDDSEEIYDDSEEKESFQKTEGSVEDDSEYSDNEDIDEEDYDVEDEEEILQSAALKKMN